METRGGNIRRLFRVMGFLCLIALLYTKARVVEADSENAIRFKHREGHQGAQIMSDKDGIKKEASMAEEGKLTEDQGQYLLSVARACIENELHGENGTVDESNESVPAIFHKRRGTFVTLTKRGKLRGCIGHIVPQESLLEGIKINALNAAFRDPRFQPLARREWHDVKIEISILTDPKPLSCSSADELLQRLRPGIDGVIIKKGYHQATFLPQVWEQLPTKEEFLSHLCLKAGFDRDEWKKGDLEVTTYQVQAFEE